MNATIAGANVLTLLLYAALGGGLFFFPLNLIQVQGFGATAASEYDWLTYDSTLGFKPAALRQWRNRRAIPPAAARKRTRYAQCEFCRS